MEKEKIDEQIRELRQRAFSVWQDAQKLVRANGHDDMIFFRYPIKSRAIEMVDNLEIIGKFLKEAQSHDNTPTA
ncbi:hypothetical protein [Cohnella zeiphila]|uniref:Uncharacterized protein n=1 Tax=Cohnella zeiphila TaxID=2761120 RepID=A0A7X0SL63_9BACL|nr:hypothetical protein [Cohnella zeiphila]MBB6731921.1 hypothetical protein [Cohnella zeiphila]